ncbi:MAG: sugar phosphate isomerase/epimerase [Candidatus Omnitrophica bacterium]|nr:sugar phosphate isomerase/epimerase [Candidatus Omnitrophota bacterium]
MKISCSSYSFHRTIAAGKLDQLSWIEKCARELELDGVELLDIHFPSVEKEYLRKLKKKIIDLGLTIAAVSASNHFTTPDDAKLRQEVAKVKKWADVSAYLGAPVLRCFAGSGQELADPAIFKQTAAALKECADYCRDNHGIVLAMENHGGTSAEQILGLVKTVDSEWFRLTLDTGNFSEDPYGSIRKTAPLAVFVHAKTYDIDERGNEKQLDYDRIFRIFREVSYQGFLSLEYEGTAEEELMIPKSIVLLKRLNA